MEIIVGKYSGFCFGVKRAVDGVEKGCKKYKKLNCLGEIVHNEVVIEDLKNKGVEFIDSIDDIKNERILAIRAHGVEEKIYKIAKDRKIKIIDYTCPKVAKIHEQIKEAQKNNKKIILKIDFKPALSEEKLDERILRDFSELKNKQFKNSLDKLLPQKLIPIIIEKSQIDPNKKVNEIKKQ